MSDLISRQDTIDAIVHELDMIDHVPQWVSDRLVKALSGVPSIDAVQVIRCKDCKYYKENTLACSRYGLEDDDYCSWAERRE